MLSEKLFSGDHHNGPTVKAKTDLVLSFLAAVLSSKESRLSLRVKGTSDLTLGGVQSMPLTLGKTGWTYAWFNKMLTNKYIY